MQRVPFPVVIVGIVGVVTMFGFLAVKLTSGSGAPPAGGRPLAAADAPMASVTRRATETALPRETPSPVTPLLPPLPARWPQTLQLGIASPPGAASAMHAIAPYGLRYQYLAGGANNGHGWATWKPDGAFVTEYIDESARNGIIPVFTYYMILQSEPGSTANDASGVLDNLQTRATMAAYYDDLVLFFKRAAAFPNQSVVLHIEPDLWGFLEQRSVRDAAASVPVVVSSSGNHDLDGLPDTAAGFAGAIGRLRDRYAPNVLLAYHLSVWGTGNDVFYSNASEIVTDGLAARAADFFTSLGGSFDLVFSDFSDRDAGFKQHQYGDGAAWWDDADFDRHVIFLREFVHLAKKRVVLWQIPQGNTKMRAMNDTWNHYQDNRVEWLLDDPSRKHIEDYARAGVVAFLFGRGADGATCACDANNDGVTNPDPINGNTLESIDASDDGGLFQQKSGAYYREGALTLGR